jgi:hypothetical protein
VSRGSPLGPSPKPEEGREVDHSPGIPPSGARAWGRGLWAASAGRPGDRRASAAGRGGMARIRPVPCCW